MGEPLNPESDAVTKLQAAAAGSEVAKLIEDPAVVRYLEGGPKQPAVGRAIQLMVEGAGGTDAALRIRCIAALASLWSLKPLRGLIDKAAPRALSEPLPEISAHLSPKQRMSVAAWLAGKRFPWLEDFAARALVTDSREEAVGKVYAGLLTATVPSTAAAMRAISRAIASAADLQGSEGAARTISFCDSLAASIQRTELPSGKDVAASFSELFLDRLLGDGRDPVQELRAKVGLAVARLAAAVIARAPAVLSSSAPSDVFAALDGKWIPSKEREWERLRSKVVARIAELVAALATNGAKAIGAARNARLIEASPGEFGRLCRTIAENSDIPSEDVAAWLRRGGEDVESTAARELPSEVEALANLMVRADELASTTSTELVQRDRLIDALVSEVMQLAARKGLELLGTRGGISKFDPQRQRCVGSTTLGARVRVLIPGVARTSESGKFQILQALVEPVGEG